MNKNNSYEKIGIKNRLHEIANLFSAIFLSLIVALLVMNVLIFPIAFVAVKKDVLFNLLFKYTFISVSVAVIIYIVTKQVKTLKAQGIAAKDIVKYIAFKPLSVVFILILILALFVLLIYLINVILGSNFYLLYKILNL